MASYCRGAGCQNIRAEGFKLCQIGLGAKHENAAVPEITAAIQIALRRAGVGFFHKARDLKGLARQRRAAFYVSISGFGGCWHNAKSHQLPVGRQRRPGLCHCQKGPDIAHHMVCREHQQHRICPALHRIQGGQRNGRCGIAPGWLQQYLHPGHPGLPHLLGR